MIRRSAVVLLTLPVSLLIAQSATLPAVRVARIVRELDGGSEGFYRISGLALGPDGEVFVAEREDHRVRAFSPDGTERRVIVSGGSGPREVRAPCCLTVTEDGFLVIRDNGNARFVLVRVRGGVDSGLVVRRQSVSGNAEVQTFSRGSTFGEPHWVSWNPARSPGDYAITWTATSGVRVSETHLSLPTWDSSTVFAKSYGGNGSNGQRFAYPLYGKQTLRAVAPDGRFAIAQSDRYVVDISSPSGRLLHRLNRSDLVGELVTQLEADSAARQLESDARRLGVPERSLPWSVPSRKPPLRHLEFDAEGNLWIERLPTAGSENIADVYDLHGSRIMSVKWPPDVRLRGFSRTLRRALGVRVTEQGETVVILDIPG